MKGHTKIQLFDAKTGKEVKSTESDNLVTDAVSNVFNGAATHLANIAGGNNILGNLNNHIDSTFIKDMYGGVLIFSKEIDKSHILPSIDEILSEIGNANLSTSISGNIYKGAFNESESVFSDTYATFVWDFTTEQCNGDIASICLTSNAGGHLGWRFNAKDSLQYSFNFLGSTQWKLNQSTDEDDVNVDYFTFKSTSSNYGSIVYTDDDKIVYTRYSDRYIYDISSYKYTINPNGTGNFYNKVTIYPETTTFDLYLASRSNYDNKSMFFKGDTDSDYNLTVYMAEGLDAVSTYTVPLANLRQSVYELIGKYLSGECLTSFCETMFHNKFVGIYVSVPTAGEGGSGRLYVIDLDGSFKYKDFTVTAAQASLLWGSNTVSQSYYSLTRTGKVLIYNDSLFWGSYTNNYGYAYIYIDVDNCDIDFSACVFNLPYMAEYNLSEDKMAALPWLRRRQIGCTSISPPKGRTILMPYAYLGTINNQEDILTKTAENTMKITYTLTF